MHIQLERAAPHPAALSAPEIISQLPPTGPEHYTAHRQPHYTDSLTPAIDQVRTHTLTATPESIAGLQSRFTSIAVEASPGSIITTGNCAERISASHDPAARQRHIRNIASNMMILSEVTQSVLPGAVQVPRAKLQMTKPRSEAADSRGNTPYMGDMINGIDHAERTPDPQRMVRGADYSVALHTELERRGMTSWSAHEGLLLPFEYAALRRDPQTGKVYSAASELIWAGERTRDPNGPHIKLLSAIANPVGVKLGPNATGEDVRQLEAVLNPGQIPGKVTYMIRMGLEHGEQLDTITNAIAKYVGSNALVGYDIHGSTVSTRQAGKTHKVRAVSVIKAGVAMLGKSLESNGLRMRYMNLEATGEPLRRECVDRIGQLPVDSSLVDPLLSPDQLEEVLAYAKPYLGQ